MKITIGSERIVDDRHSFPEGVEQGQTTCRPTLAERDGPLVFERSAIDTRRTCPGLSAAAGCSDQRDEARRFSGNDVDPRHR